MFTYSDSSSKMVKIKELLDWNALSREQKWMISGIVDLNWSWRKIRDEYFTITHTTISFEAISTCIIRSGLSREWTKGMVGGNDPYLCDQDYKKLEDLIAERANLTQALNIKTVLDEAEQLKVLRFQKCIEFLGLLGYSKLIEKIYSQEVKSPSRSWINGIENIIDFHLKNPKKVPTNRFLACSFDIINSYFRQFSELFRMIPEALFFVGDETMMAPNKPLKVLVPKEMQNYIEPLTEQSSHITGFCVNNLCAVKPPLLVILTGLKRLPEELKTFVNSGKIWLASSPTGWMDRQIFLAWCVNFVNWLYNYRSMLPPNIADKAGVLVLDGHTSRECPAGLELLRFANLHVIILPSHTTHVLQLFDVVLASPMKKSFTIYFDQLAKDNSKYIAGNMAASLRRFSVEAFERAWGEVCNTMLVTSGAAQCGLMPVSATNVLNSPFVRNFTEAERQIYQNRMARMQNRLSTSNCEINEPAKIEEIRQFLSTKVENENICRQYANTFTGTEALQYHISTTSDFIRGIKESNSRWLSPIFPIFGNRYEEIT